MSHELSHGAHDENLALLSLQELQEALRLRGIEMSYSALSEMIGTGDIADQLRAGRKGNSRQFLPVTVDVLAGFLQEFRRAKGKFPQSPDMLRSYLPRYFALSGNSELIPAPTYSALSEKTGNALTIPSKPAYEAPVQAHDPVLLAAVAGRAQGLAAHDKVLTADQAADFLCCSVSTLRRNYPPFRKLTKTVRGWRWRLSDLLKEED